jgi:hypothetical protein
MKRSFWSFKIFCPFCPFVVTNMFLAYVHDVIPALYLYRTTMTSWIMDDVMASIKAWQHSAQHPFKETAPLVGVDD